MFYLKLFGYPSLTRDGDAQGGRVAQRHRIALLSLLAVASPRGVSREWLMAMLWPDTAPERARNLLKVSVYVLRRALGPDALRSDRDELRLDPTRIDSDVKEFERALESGDPALAARIYGGVFLEGFFLKHAPTFERWVDGERDRLARSYLGALEAVAEAAEQRGALAATADAWEAAAARSPYDSRLALRVIRAREALGNHAGALQYATSHERILRTDLGIPPSPEVTSFTERLRAVTAPLKAAGRGAAEPPEAVDERPRVAGGRTPPFHLQTLGGLGLRGREGFTTATSAEERSGLLLLTLLASAGAGGVPRETLLLYFWPETPWREADGSLDRLIGRVRSWTDDSAILGADPVRLDPEVVCSDLADLQHAARGGAADDVLALCRGPFLEGVDGDVTPELEAWVTAQRQRFADLREHAAAWADRTHSAAAGVPAPVGTELGKRGRRPRALAHLLAASSLGALAFFAVRAWSADDAPPAANREAFPPTGDLARETTSSSAARDLYDQGMVPTRFRNDSIGRVSLDYFQRAVDLDPSFAGAHAALALMYVRVAPAHALGMRRGERLKVAERHARRAVRMADSLAPAHGVLGSVLLGDYRFAEAEEAFGRALALDPRYELANQLMTHLFIFRGRLDEALVHALRARELEPASVNVTVEVARAYLVNGRCDVANGWLDSLSSVEPPLLWASEIRAECLTQEQRWAEAIEIMRAGVPAGGSQVLASLGLTLGQAARAGSITGPDPARIRTEWAEEARAVRDTLIERASRGLASAYDVATVYVGLGELDLSIDWMEEAVKERSLRFAVRQPRYRALHAHPRFDSLLVRLGITAR
jgi:DNA-binding SARP family transcriptional activator